MTILDRFRLLLRRRSDASLPPADPRRWAILAHYDADGVVAGYVVALAAALRGLGANLMVVSTAPGLDEDGRAALGELGATIHLRANRGFDFGSWQYGLGSFRKGSSSTNSSSPTTACSDHLPTCPRSIAA